MRQEVGSYRCSHITDTRSASPNRLSQKFRKDPPKRSLSGAHSTVRRGRHHRHSQFFAQPSESEIPKRPAQAELERGTIGNIGGYKDGGGGWTRTNDLGIMRPSL